MKVNFNNLRRQAVGSYERLVQKLNNATLKKDTGEFVDGYGPVTKGDILIPADEIQKDMDDLRQMLGSIAMVYEPGDENFKDVFSEMHQGETSMTCFNPE